MTRRGDNRVSRDDHWGMHEHRCMSFDTDRIERLRLGRHRLRARREDRALRQRQRERERERDAELARYRVVERSMANVLELWKRAVPWLFYPDGPAIRSDGIRRGHATTPAYATFRAVGWRHQVNNYVSHKRLCTGISRSVHWCWKVRRWVWDDTGLPVKHLA